MKLMMLLQNANQQTMTWTTPLIAPFLLLSRIWVAWVFFQSGLLKYSQWDSTLYLFEYEYHVPLLSPLIAAYLATSIELLLPLLLVFGLLTRLTAFALFLFNIMAVASYPILWEQGFVDHQLWGVILAILLIWGGGFFSLDRWIKYSAQQKAHHQTLSN